MFALRADPLLGPRVAERPGLRIPGEWDPFECAVGAILRAEDQDAVQTLMARVVDRFGDKISKPGSALTSLFPTPKAIANGNFAGLGLSRSTVNTLRKLAQAVVDCEIDFCASSECVIESLTKCHVSIGRLRSTSRYVRSASPMLFRRTIRC